MYKYCSLGFRLLLHTMAGVTFCAIARVVGEYESEKRASNVFITSEKETKTMGILIYNFRSLRLSENWNIAGQMYSMPER